ncbi:MAG: alpha-amylase family glycosyl hydrolase [Bacteroidales bacterium]
MTIHRHRIPTLPYRPVTNPVARQIRRSYPVGRQSFSRACKGKNMVLTITTEEPMPENVRAVIVSAMNSKEGNEWEKFPFERMDDHTLLCEIKPKHPGLFAFRAEFSPDNGASWFRDSVADAWVLVDPPQVDALRMYTIIPNASGTITDWISDLHRIRGMGFNAIHLLPLTSLDTSESPYAARDFFDIDPGYLDKNSSLDGLTQLEKFIEEAMKLEIRLVFDLVLNHVGVNSNMSKQAPDWIVPDMSQEDGFQRARFWANDGWHYWNDLILINYEHPSDTIRREIWSYMIDYALFWAKYANYTGGFVRFDNLHSSNPEFIQELTKELHSKYPNVGILAEYFADETTLLHTGPKWGLNFNLATPWDYKFVPQLRNYLNYIHRVSRHIRYFMPVTSHDSGTPAQEFGSVHSTIPRYVAAALLGTGATGIIQGVEAGIQERINFIGRRPKMMIPAESMFASFIAQVNTILANYPAFRHGENCVFVDGGHEAIIAAFRENTGTSVYGFLVLCNFDIGGSHQISIDLTPILGTHEAIHFVDLLCDRNGSFPDPQLDLHLDPCSAQVLMLSREVEIFAAS